MKVRSPAILSPLHNTSNAIISVNVIPAFAAAAEKTAET